MYPPPLSTGGYLAHSLAILTDAAHLLTDFASIMISLFALWVSSRPPTKTMNFGWHRAGNGAAPPWGSHPAPGDLREHSEHPRVPSPQGTGASGSSGELWQSPGTTCTGRAEAPPSSCRDQPWGWVLGAHPKLPMELGGCSGSAQ